MDREEIIQEALNVYHNYNISMEEAMDFVLEDSYAQHVQNPGARAMTGKVPSKGMGPGGKGGIANGYGSDVRFNGNWNPGRVATADRDYGDLGGIQRVFGQGILKQIDDWNYMEPGPARDGLAYKISKTINNPIIRDQLMRSGYWDRIPSEIKAVGVMRNRKKYDKWGRKYANKMGRGNAAANKYESKWDRQDDKKIAKYDAKAAKAERKAAKKAAKESVYATAIDMMNYYPDVDMRDALEASLEMHGYDESIFEPDYDLDEYYDSDI